MQDSHITNITNSQSLFNKVFGASAELCLAAEENSAEITISSEDVIYEVFMVAVVLGAIFFYCTIIYKYKSIISSILNRSFSKFAEDNLRESNDMKVNKVLFLSSLFYLLSLIIGFSKMYEFELFTNNSSVVVNYGILISFVAFSVVSLFEYLVDKILNWYNNTSSFFEELFFEKILTSSLCGIIIMPITLLTVFTPLNTLIYTKYIFYFFIILSLIYYYIKTYNFFSLKKVSLLQYILYFCIVDFVPISFFYVITNRYIGI